MHRVHPEVTVDLQLNATDKVSHFVNLPGLYSHWSLLCEYSGRILHAGATTEIDGLCTFEFARGIGMNSLPFRHRHNLPVTFFTYHVINIDSTTQALMTQVLGPRGAVLARAVYIRGLDDYGREHSDGVTFEIDSYAPAPRPTPNRSSMRLPRDFRWGVKDLNLTELVAIEGHSNDDWAYGLGAGFVGSYKYHGRFQGRPIEGTGYVEFIDLRS